MTSIALITPALTLTRLLVGVVDSGGCGCDWACFGQRRSVAADTPAPSCPSVPAPPASVTAADQSGQAEVSWTTPLTDGDQSITGYAVVAYDETSDTTGPTETVPATDLSAVVSGLTPGYTYTFTVSAVNVIGTGLPAVSNAVTIPFPTLVDDDNHTDAPTPTTS